MKEVDANKLRKSFNFFGAKKRRGSIFSVFRSEIAQELGVDLEKGRKIYLVCIGGRILGYLHEVSLSLGNKTFLCKVVFSSEYNVSFNLLGRDNFFLAFYH